MGNSAGAISVGFHLFSPSSWPYFRNAILDSGGPKVKGFELVTSEKATLMSKNHLASVGCNVTKSNEEILKCAQGLQANVSLFKECSDQKYYFIIDNFFFNKTIDELAKEKAFKKCKILTGFNSDEFVLYFTKPILGFLGNEPSLWLDDLKKVGINEFNSTIEYFNGNEMAKDNLFYFKLTKEYLSSQDFANLNNKNTTSIDFSVYLNRIESDYIFICQSFNLAEMYFDQNEDVYVYEYGYKIASSSFPETIASAIHVDELPIVFGEPMAIKVNFFNLF